MPDLNKSSTLFKSETCEDILRNQLNKYLKGIKKMENGGQLHSMVITMVEKPLLKMVMEETCGNQSQAAHILGMNRNTLRRKLGEYKIKVKVKK
jgi:DNA-binding protein Fis